MNVFRWLFRRRPRPGADGPPVPPGMDDVFGGPDDETPYVMVPTRLPDGQRGTILTDRLTFEYQSGRARGAAPTQAALDAEIRRADRVRVLAGGMWRDEAIGVAVLIDSRSKPELDALRDALRIAEDPSRFGHCSCLGSPTVEFYAGRELLATIGLHHGHTIRWDRWLHDAPLAEPDRLARWLAGHGLPTDPPPDDQDPMSVGLLKLGRAERLAHRGQSYWARGDLARAVEECERALEVRPGLPLAHAVRAQVHRQAGRFAEAVADCDAALAGGMEHPEIYQCRAVARDGLGQLEAAVEDCDAALRLDPGHANALNSRGFLRGRLGRVDAALEDFAAAIRLAPDWIRPLATRGQMYLMVGRPDAALGDFNEVIGRLERAAEAAVLEGRPAAQEDGIGLAAAYVLRAQAFERCGAADQAREDYGRAVEFGPDDPRMFLARGDFLARQGEPEAAVADYSEALAVRPDLVEGYVQRSLARRMAGELEEAAADLDDAIRWRPDDGTLFGMRGELNLLRGRHDAALADLERSIELEPGVARAYLLRSQCWKHRGEPARLRDDLETAVRLAPDDLLSVNALSWMLATAPDAALRDGPRARALAQKAVDRTAGQVAEFLDTLAAALAECGEFDAACALQRRALERAPDPDREVDYRARLALYEDGRPYRLEP